MDYCGLEPTVGLVHLREVMKDGADTAMRRINTTHRSTHDKGLYMRACTFTLPVCVHVYTVS